MMRFEGWAWCRTENTVSGRDSRAGRGDVQRIQSVMRFEGWVWCRTENTVSDEIRGLGVVTYREYSQ